MKTRRLQLFSMGLGLVAGLATMLGMVSELSAAPKYVRLSHDDATHSTMTVSWNTDGNVGTKVLYGTTAGNLSSEASGMVNPGPGSLGFIHEVTVTGLQPNTTYFYKAGDDVEGYSAEYSFITAPSPHEECGKFRFMFMGDNRPDPIFGGGENYDKILVEAEGHSSRFLLVGGDLVIDGDQIDQWATFLAYTESTSAFVPVMPAIGNHDTGPGEGDGANYNRIFALPTSTGAYGSNTEDYYHFTYGNVIVASLSTEGFDGGNIPFETQASYLDEVLTNNPKKWKIVILHKPIYTYEDPFGVTHEPNEEKQNAALVPIFDKHHVDIVLASHNHWYERYEPSACATQGKPGSDKTCSVGGDPAFGTIYIVSGGAGAFTIPQLLCGLGSGQVACSADHHYILFDVDDSKLTLETWSAFPQASKVIDSVVIQKTSNVECPTQGTGGAGGSTSSSGMGGSTSSGSGGGSSSSGAGGSSTSSGNNGAGGTTPPADDGIDVDSGCGCEQPGSNNGPRGWWLALAAAALGLARKRRSGHYCPTPGV